MSKPDIKIKLSGIEVLSKSMKQRPLEGLQTANFNFDIKSESQVNPEKKLVLIKTEVGIREMGGEERLASMETIVAFLIENFDDIILKRDNNIYDIPPEFNLFLTSSAISTMRGIMFSEFQGTYLYQANLPIIVLPTPQPIIEQDEKDSVAK